MRKFIIVLVIVLLLMVLSSCSMKYSTRNRNSYIDDPITIILPMNGSVSGNEKYGEYASELLADKGFNVEFVFYKLKLFESPSFENFGYYDFISKEIAKDKNVIFEAWGKQKEFEKDGNLLELGENGEYYISNNIDQIRYNYTGIYINRKLEEEFGKPVHSIDDYEEFLYWAKEKVSDVKPGLIYISSERKRYIDYNIPLSLFAQVSGYIRADNLANWVTNDCVNTEYFSLNELKDETLKPKILDAVELPFFTEMDIRLRKWAEDGLISFADTDRFDIVSGYASFVQNVMSTTVVYDVDKFYGELYKIDAGEFNLRIPTEDGMISPSPLAEQIDASKQPSWLAASKNSPNPIAVHALINWIYKTRENYTYFMCGKEGVDYTIEDNRMKFLVNDKGLNYGEWHGHAPFFDARYDIQFPHWPYNWFEVKEQLDIAAHIDISTVKNKYAMHMVDDELILREKYDIYGAYQDYIKFIRGRYEEYYNNIRNKSDNYSASDLYMDILSNRETIRFIDYYNALVDLYYMEELN